jgi:hypothetical protein
VNRLRLADPDNDLPSYGAPAYPIAVNVATEYAAFYQRRYRVAKSDGRWWVTPA